MDTAESEDIKIQCKKCGQEIEEPSKKLEHIFLVHNDHEAAELLTVLNRLSGRGT